MGLLSCKAGLSFTAIRYGVEHSVLHKDADRSTDEGGEEVNVDVIACAVETPEREEGVFGCNRLKSGDAVRSQVYGSKLIRCFLLT